VLLIIAKNLTLLNRPTSQLPLIRMRWQKFSGSPVTLTLHPKRHALARSKNVVITSESARGTREGSAFRSKFSAAHFGGELPFRVPHPSCLPPQGGPARPEPQREHRREPAKGRWRGWSCFVGRGFVRFIFVPAGWYDHAVSRC
jgi:hypothetical protein